MNRSEEAKTMDGLDLGEPLSVYDAARLIGCSPWTVRQKHVKAGLPCFRSGSSGRLTFYRNQVVAWILEKQKLTKGGQTQ
jgi:phage terminase Nu1 subunit (DNA packaging protein)